MTKLEKLSDIDTMAKFLNHVVQDCDFYPCMEHDICNGFCKDCSDFDTCRHISDMEG